MMRRVVDYRRVGANEHEVVGSRRPRDFGEVFVTQGKFLCILEIDGDVVLEVLHMVAGVLVPGHPGLMLVVGVVGRRVLSVRELRTVRTLEGAEVVVESVVFLDDKNNMVDLAGHFLTPPFGDREG